MALDLGSAGINSSFSISELMQQALAPFAGKIDFLLTLSKILLIIAIIYFIILIISKLMKIRDSKNLSTIEDNVKSINDKLSLLTDKKVKVEKKQKTK